VRQLEPKFAVANGVPALHAPPYTPQTTRNYASTQKQTQVRDRGGLFTPAQPTLSDSEADTVFPRTVLSIRVRKVRLYQRDTLEIQSGRTYHVKQYKSHRSVRAQDIRKQNTIIC